MSENVHHSHAFMFEDDECKPQTLIFWIISCIKILEWELLKILINMRLFKVELILKFYWDDSCLELYFD
jgi:hypothetical protein